ncbi:MAG: serine/threonine protein kinase [Kofleriaceae bacterium]|nr:MAG: serine/threonine protein kinase [Kofleriaceae bacterium]MBZ0230747.1 serine/threonine protein kinase [Kofleriaceae bacterium]
MDASLTPATVCDVLLDAAITADADSLWLEPRAGAEDRYELSIERQGRALATSTLDGAMGAAVVARLALLADIDLVSRRPASGSCVVRLPKTSAEIIVTTRPGRSPRAEVFVRNLSRPRVVAATPATIGGGAQLGQYTIETRLGAGGMGQVFKATHRVLGRACALKILNHEGASPDAAARFLREARAAARIKHPNIVDVFDFGHVPDGRPYLVMELLDGKSLGDFMDGDPLEPRLAVKIARELASALAASHAAGVVHADVSPSNVLIEGDTAKLVDFGLAQMLDDPGRLAAGEASEFVFGTPAYISPEIIRGLNAEPASDQYALGAVLYEMLSGEPPFRATSVRELCIKHLTAPVPAVESPVAALPPELGRIVTRCLAKKPGARFPSMAELHAALVEAEQAFAVGGWRRFLTP